MVQLKLFSLSGYENSALLKNVSTVIFIVLPWGMVHSSSNQC